MRRAEAFRPQISVNVYQASQGDPSGSSFHIPGCCGAYHSGVVINGTEYSFGSGTGVYECRPGEYGEVVQRVEIGQSTLDNGGIKQAIDRLRSEFGGDQYHLVLLNCNHFSEAFVRACTGGKLGLPTWVNRAAWWGSWFACCFGRSADRQPLLATGSRSNAPQQQAPMFAGDGMTLSDEQKGTKQLTVEEQRQIRLRTFEVVQ